MYSGLTLTRSSGKIFGTHQKIDRIARRQLDLLLPGIKFPDINSILHFEGDHGPDGIKRKNPGTHEWHFIEPFNDSDTELVDFISYHYQELINALSSSNKERSSFEAAWLAHAIVDGLTPAHHYPYEQKLTELRQGQPKHTRNSLYKMLVMPGSSAFHSLKNNWKLYGPKGLLTTHAAFEMGIATLIAPLGFNNDLAAATEYITSVSNNQVGPWFRTLAQHVANLKIYDSFYKSGWTIKLSNQIKKQLAPTLINAVTAAWYCAYRDSKELKKD